MNCVGLALGVAVLWCEPQRETPTDSFCLGYQKVVQAKGDSEIKAKLDVKKRVLANELFYKKYCSGVKR